MAQDEGSPEEKEPPNPGRATAPGLAHQPGLNSGRAPNQSLGILEEKDEEER